METSFPTLARWSVWANQRLYEACRILSDEEYFAPRACAFGSIHRTLNHLLATDRIWLGRLTGEAHSIPSLDYEICTDFASLSDARAREDRRIHPSDRRSGCGNRAERRSSLQQHGWQTTAPAALFWSSPTFSCTMRTIAVRSMRFCRRPPYRRRRSI